MLDPLVAAVGIGLVAAVVAGPALAYGLDLVPERRRRTIEWAVVGGALATAFLADSLSQARLGGVLFVYVLAALPGVVAFLAFRTVVASLFVSLLPMYFVIAELSGRRVTYVPELALDRAVSVQPAWMLVYGSLYVFIGFLPVAVVRGRELFRRALQGYLTVMLVSFAGFLLYPTAAPRPAEVSGDGFASWSLRLAYDLDPPYNCFPSLHVAWAFVSALACDRVHPGVGAAAVLWAALIAVSTLYTKQHYAVDVIAGIVAAGAAYVLFLRTYPREAVAERDRRAAPRRALTVVAIFAVMVAGFWVAYRIQAVAASAVTPASGAR